MRHSLHLVHRRYVDLIADRRPVCRVEADDICEVGRDTIRNHRAAETWAGVRASLRHWPNPRALAWLAVVALPPPARAAAGEVLLPLERRMPQPVRARDARWRG